MASTSAKVVLITGCSTGVGRALSLLLSASSSPSYRVYASMRSLSEQTELVSAAGDRLNKNLFIKQLDVTDSSSVRRVIDDIVKTEGKIDVLVNNAGVGLSGIIDIQTEKEIRENFETNFFGVVFATQAVLPHMKAQNSGQIIQLSSMGGVNGVPYNDIYCASKFAVEGFSESLAPSVRNFNIKVNLVEPGPIVTDFIANALKDATGKDGDFTPPNFEKCDEKTKQNFISYRSRMLAGFTPGFAETGEEVAGKIKAIIESENPPLRTQTNEKTHPLAKLKFADPSGNAGVDAAYKRFFA